MKIKPFYKDYVGQYVKRFYAPFDKESIYRINGYREIILYNDIVLTKYFKSQTSVWGEFLYQNIDNSNECEWRDCEDSCIITNEKPIKNRAWVANVRSKNYKGFNPFSPSTSKDK